MKRFDEQLVQVECGRRIAGREHDDHHLEYRAPRGLDRTLFQKLAQGDWIDVRIFLPLSMILPTALAMAAPPTTAEREP